MKFLVLSGLLALGNAAPQLSPEAAAKAIEQVQFDISQPILPAVPGIAEHQAALDSVLALQGRNPGSNVHALAVARQQQAEQALLALQAQQGRKRRSPQLSHEAAVKLLEQSQFDLSQPLLPEVPGIAEHQAALNSVLALQGRNPGVTNHAAAEARHLQAEQQLIALQSQQAAGRKRREVPQVPGLEQHAAQIAEVLRQEALLAPAPVLTPEEQRHADGVARHLQFENDLKATEQQLIALQAQQAGRKRREVPQVPGLDQHAAQIEEVLRQEAALLGTTPELQRHAQAEARHLQFENDLIALQAQQAAGRKRRQAVLPQVPGLAEHQAAEAKIKALIAQAEAAGASFRSAEPVVSDTGSIGPSGLVGPSGNIGPSGLCGPTGCIAFG